MSDFKKNMTPAGGPTPPKKGMDPEKKKLALFFLIPIVFFIVIQMMGGMGMSLNEMSYSEFFQILEKNPSTGNIAKAEMVENIVRGKLKDGSYFQVRVPMSDMELVPLLRQNVQDFTVNPPQIFWRNLIYSVAPVLLLIAFFWFFVYRGVQQGGGKIFSFGKSKARLSDKNKSKTTFADVAGVDEAKEDLREVIDFLSDPGRYQKLGGKIPKGVLLMGPPGTGKTLMAKAVAGEADVPFFSISGSDFVEMFVGVGAARVRDLFEQAKKAAKTNGRGAIIFIDEIDAVGRQRFSGVGGGNDEREQTLNALLVEMDGFDTDSGVILIGSTNRPDVLDAALLRPGRFDRQVVIERPDILGREEILSVHSKDITLDKNCDLKKLAKLTAGFSGADLANLINEGALLAARRKQETVTQTDLEESIERVMVGPERKSRVISAKEKEIKAVHESGHALVALMTPNSDPVSKISIIPRGMGVGGFTLQRPDEERNLITRQEIHDRIAVLLGGRVAEEIHFGEITSGASDDLQKATHYAQMMVCELGMSERLGNLTYGRKASHSFLGNDVREVDYSDQTALIIDEEVSKIVHQGYDKAKQILTENRNKLNLLSKEVLEKETLDEDQILQLLGLKQEKASESDQDSKAIGDVGSSES